MDPTCHPLFSFLSLSSPSHRTCPMIAAPATPPYIALSSVPSPIRCAARPSPLSPFVVSLDAGRGPQRSAPSSRRCSKRALEVCPYARPRGPTPDSHTLEGPPCSPTVVVLLELIHCGPLELHRESRFVSLFWKDRMN